MDCNNPFTGSQVQQEGVLLDPLVYKRWKEYVNIKIKESLEQERFSASGNVQRQEDIEFDQSASLVRLVFNHKRYAGDIVEAYDNWVIRRLKEQFMEQVIANENYSIQFTNAYVLSPSIGGEKGERLMSMLPHIARSKGLTYAGDLVVTFILTHNGIGRQEGTATIGKIPIMLRSSLCHLRGMSDQQMLEAGECPYECEGSFIVKGTQRTIVTTEHLRWTRAFLFYDPEEKAAICAMTCVTPKTTVRINTMLRNGCYEVFLSFFRQGQTVNAYTVIRALDPDITSIQDITDKYIRPMVSEKYFQIISPLLSQTAAMAAMVNDPYEEIINKSTAAQKGLVNPVGMVQSCLIYYLFPQMEMTTELDRIKKLQMLGMMIAKHACYTAGLITMDDRDHYGNKRLAGPAEELEHLMRSILNKITSDTNEKLRHLNRDSTLTITQVETFFKESDIITKTINSSFSTGNWGLKDSYQTVGMTEAHSIDNRVRATTQICKIRKGANSQAKNTDVRKVHPSQRRYICPADTPEGEGCGLIGIKGITCYISVNRDPVPLRRYIDSDDSPGYSPIFDLSTSMRERLVINGRFIGFCDGYVMRQFILSLRRSLRIGYDTCIALIEGTLLVNTDGSRATAPLLILDENEVPIIDKHEDLWEYYTSIELVSKDYEVIDLGNGNYAPFNPEVPSETKGPKGPVELEGSSETKGFEGPKSPLGSAGSAGLNRIKIRRGDEQLVIKRRIKKEIEDGGTLRPLELMDLVRRGCIEFVDALEQEQLDHVVADSRQVIEDRKLEIYHIQRELEELEDEIGLMGDPSKLDEEGILRYRDLKINHARRDNQLQEVLKYPYSHMELEPNSLFGVSGASITLAGMNPGPRNTYQCGMGKQALAGYHSLIHTRFDTTVRTAHGQLPAVATQMSRVLGLESHPAGENLIIAIMNWKGYNQEDSIMINRSSIERGLLASEVYKTHKVSEKVTGDMSELFGVMPDRRKDPRFKNISDNGMPVVGSFMKAGDAIVGRVRTVKTGETIIEDASVFIKEGEEGYVFNVMYMPEGSADTHQIKIVLRQPRIPIIGDKIATRCSQKTTIGLVVDEADMPMTMDGVKPDVIFNTLSFPSRMTVSLLVEILFGKYAAMAGRRIDGTTFRPIDKESIMDALTRYGFEYSGETTMIDGTTGEMFDSKIFMGVCFYQILKHFVVEKFQSRSTGRHVLATRQPEGGKSKGSAIRFGYMERDATIASGAAGMINSRICADADALEGTYCMSCKQIRAYQKEGDNDIICRQCKSKDIGKLKIPYSLVTLMTMAAASGIKMDLNVKKLDKERSINPIQ